MSIKVSEEGAGVRVFLPRQMVVGTRREVRRELQRLLDEGVREFVIDFIETDHCDTSGWGALVAFKEYDLDPIGGRMELQNMNEDIETTYELQGLQRRFGRAA